MMDGRIEAVMWIVQKDGKTVVEKKGDIFTIPGTFIDRAKDLGTRYMEYALMRGIQEKFSLGSFVPKNWKYIASVDFDNESDKFKLHYFLVDKWEGYIPAHGTKDGDKESDLRWLPLDRYQELPQSCDKKAMEKLIEINNKL